MLVHDRFLRDPTWEARKKLQWDRVKDAMPGLQLVVWSRRTSFMMTCSTDGFYESIVFGQRRGTKRIGQELVPDERYPPIDLTDDQIDTVLERWQAGKSALSLPFVNAVWGRDGRQQVKQ